MKTSIAAGTVLFATVCLPLAAAAADRHHVRPSPTRPPAASANIQYYGGPVIAQTQIVNVLWGMKVDPNVVMGAEGFYQALITSNYMDCLGEYDTAGVTVTRGSGGGSGTSQHIDRGTSVQTVTISPTKLTGTMMLSDVNAELTNQLQAGHLPMPAKDPDGTIDTIFMIALPPGLNLNDGGGTSCASGSNGWCASHYTLSFSGMNIPFAILPDYSTGGCAKSCGAAQSTATGFDAFTFNAAHEFVEAVTDPDDPPIGWYDMGGNQEIADACDSETTIGMIGSYQVEEFWSRRLGKCISGDPNLPPCSSGMRPCTPAEPDGGPSGSGSSSSGSSTSSGGSSSGSASGGTSGSSSSGSGSSSGSTGSSGSTSGGGANSSSGTTGSSSGTTGSSSGGSGAGGSGSGAGGSGGDGGAGNGFAPGESSTGCGCVSVGTDPSSDVALFAAGAFALGALVRRRRSR